MIQWNRDEQMVAVLVSKKRALLTNYGIFIKRGVSKKDAIIKLRSFEVPKTINVKLYNSYIITAREVEHIPFYD